jgi:hypothetical protein
MLFPFLLSTVSSTHWASLNSSFLLAGEPSHDPFWSDFRYHCLLESAVVCAWDDWTCTLIYIGFDTEARCDMPDLSCEIDLIPYNSSHQLCSGDCQGAAGLSTLLIIVIALVSAAALAAAIAGFVICCVPVGCCLVAGIASEPLAAEPQPYYGVPYYDAPPSFVDDSPYGPPIQDDDHGCTAVSEVESSPPIGQQGQSH